MRVSLALSGNGGWRGGSWECGPMELRPDGLLTEKEEGGVESRSRGLLASASRFEEFAEFEEKKEDSRLLADVSPFFGGAMYASNRC